MTTYAIRHAGGKRLRRIIKPKRIPMMLLQITEQMGGDQTSWKDERSGWEQTAALARFSFLPFSDIPICSEGCSQHCNQAERYAAHQTTYKGTAIGEVYHHHSLLSGVAIMKVRRSTGKQGLLQIPPARRAEPLVSIEELPQGFTTCRQQ